MAREDAQLVLAKRSFRTAKEVGNHHEEAKWANVVGNILKNRGDYVEALRWLHIDYDLSRTHHKDLLPTCQSLGEVYLRLEYFKEALVYQKKHLELAKDSEDLVEQQRASTQLGRTYHAMFLKSNDDHCSVRNAKKYFKAAMKLAQNLKESPPSKDSSFLDEFIDAHNNIGMLEMDLDNLEEAEKILTRGLEICDEEEVVEDNDGRSRLHHNLGNVYTELRMWNKAREHIESDILICKRIGHCQGEAKGYINLGELHNRVQNYDDAITCYNKALKLAKSMEDEDALVDQIVQNITVVKESMKVMDNLKKEEQNLKKLSRDLHNSRGTSGERKCLLQQNACLDRLIEYSNTISAWLKHREFAKRKKKVATDLCDKEKLSDAYLCIGESWQKLRKFRKALKWYKKAWEAYKSIGNVEGQALVKINIGGVLDSDGDWIGALDAFEDGYRIATEANLPSIQVSAMENMHYSHMIRFDNVEKARELQCSIDNLRQSKSRELDGHEKPEDCCSETDTEEDDCVSYSRSKASTSPSGSKPFLSRLGHVANVEELKDDEPLISLLRSGKPFTKLRKGDQETRVPCVALDASPERVLNLTSNQKTFVGRKRVHMVLSDDENEMNNLTDSSRLKIHEPQAEDVATSSEYRSKCDADMHQSPSCEFQDISSVASKGAVSFCNPVVLEESTCSHKSSSSSPSAQKLKSLNQSSLNQVIDKSNPAHSGSNNAGNFLQNCNGAGHDECCQTVIFKIDDELIHMKAELSAFGGDMSIESLKVQVACLYYLQLPQEKRRKGLLPIIQHMKCGARALESLEVLNIKDQSAECFIEVLVDGWVQKPLMKLYIDCCEDLSEAPNLKMLKKLYNLEISEDEVIVSECELQDLSIAPLLNALHARKTVSMLDLSHNLLGNGTMEKLKQVLASLDQKYGGLTLDLHCNRFGPTALFQICECPVLFARLEVLNISGNRLTDACGSYLSTILVNCKALYSLNIERCSLTSRTIQKLADSLDPDSVLSQLWLGYNNPISANAIMNLLHKLSSLKRLSELNLSALKLGKPVIDRLCQLLSISALSVLVLEGTSIGNGGATQLTESLYSGMQNMVKLDLSCCGLTSEYMFKLKIDFPMIGCITELNLTGNPIMQEGGMQLASLLTSPDCCIKILVLNNCHLGLTGVLKVMQSLAVNNSLEELHLVENADLTKDWTSELLHASLDVPNASSSECIEKADTARQESCVLNTNLNQLEVADSEDEQTRDRPAASDSGNSGTSSFQRDLSSREYQYIEELSTAISMSTVLTLLDLSNNGLSAQCSETLYSAWSVNSRAAVAQKHIKEKTVHFSVEGIKCCKAKPCCRRD